MALPGSLLYKEALESGSKLPDTYEGYSFHSYNTQNLSTEFLKDYEILKLRDEAFIEYHSYPPFLERIKNSFGDTAMKNIKEMTRIKLKRKIIEENEDL